MIPFPFPDSGFYVLVLPVKTFLNCAQSLFRRNSSNFVMGASRGETYPRSSLKDYLYHGLLVSLHWAIPFLWLVSPPGLLASLRILPSTKTKMVSMD